MNGQSLAEQLERLNPSEDGIALLRLICPLKRTDETGAIIVFAAAVLLAREHPLPTFSDGAALQQLTDEFADLVFHVRAELQASHPPEVSDLDAVGGQDAAKR